MIMVLGPTKKKAEAMAEQRAAATSPGTAHARARRRRGSERRHRRPATALEAEARGRAAEASADRGADATAPHQRHRRRPDHSLTAAAPNASTTERHKENGTMPKKKTHSGAKKRFRVTGTGKVLREQANHRHLLERQVLAEGPRASAWTSSCSKRDVKKVKSLLGN